MIRTVAMLAAATSLAGCVSGVRVAPGAATDLDRQILLTLPAATLTAAAVGGQPGRAYVRRRSYGPPPAIDSKLNSLAAAHGIERIDGWPIRSLGVYCEVFLVPDGVAIDSVIAELMSDPRVDLVQRMNVFETLSGRYDDPYVDLQSAMPRLGLEQAHELATGKGVRIAIIDSAVDAMHPELIGHMRVDYDLVPDRPAPRRGEVHGTAVAGIIAATAGNHEGIVGIAPDADIAGLRACWPSEPGASMALCSSFSLAQALEVAIDLAPGIINLSLAGPADPLLSRLLGEAIQRGIIVVTAEPPRGDGETFPASEAGVIVARPANADASANAAPAYVLPAPASEILTTIPPAGYAFMSGSSLAAAHVSGVMALLLERSPTLTTTEAAALLTQTATTSADSATINACSALEQLTRTGVCSAAAILGAATYSPKNP